MLTAAVVLELPPKKQKPPSKTESLYGPQALWDRLAEIARGDGRSMSSLVVAILEHWLEQYEADAAAKSRQKSK